MKPGEAYDSRGFPIYPGDLLRSFHFMGSRYGRYYYLYHVAVLRDGELDMVPTAYLEKSLIAGGGRCHLTERLAAETEIINGSGPGKCLDFRDRPRR